MTVPVGDPVAAAQAALSGEHACIYGYGVVGAHLPGDAEPAHEGLQRHRARRDALAALLTADGVEPVAAAATYALPRPVTDAASAAQLARETERRLAALYADLVAAAGSPEMREFAARALVGANSAVLSQWEAAQVAFPGLHGRPGTPADG